MPLAAAAAPAAAMGATFRHAKIRFQREPQARPSRAAGLGVQAWRALYLVVDVYAGDVAGQSLQVKL